jgi:WD40 repeat protein
MSLVGSIGHRESASFPHQEAHGVKDLLRLRVFDVRVLGAIAFAALMAAHLAQPQEVRKSARPRIVSGRPGVETVSLAVSSDGQWIATCDNRGKPLLRAFVDTPSADRVLEFPGFGTSVAFSPNGRVLAGVGFEPVICLWDVTSESSKPSAVVNVPMDRARQAVFSPDGKSLAVSTDRDGAILVWDLVAQQPRTTLHLASPVIKMAFSPDSRWLAAAETRNDWSIVLFEIRTGVERTLLANGPGPVSSLTFSPDSAVLASASYCEQYVRLWNLEKHTRWRKLAGHGRSVTSVAFSPDGSLLVTAANDHAIGLWDVASGKQLASLQSYARCLRTIAFAPDGRTVILATEDDDDIRLWDIAELL